MVGLLFSSRPGPARPGPAFLPTLCQIPCTGREGEVVTQPLDPSGPWCPQLVELEPLWLAAWKAAFNVLHHGARAEDAADEALHRLTLECWRNDQEAARFAWIRTTAYRLAVDLRRTRGAETESWPPEVLDTQAAQSSTDNLEATRHASRWRARLEELRQQLKERLTPFQSKVLDRVLLGWTNYVIAADLGVDPHEVRRARRAIVRWALKKTH